MSENETTIWGIHGGPTGDADNPLAGRRVLPGLSCDSQSELFIRILGFNVSVLFAHYNAGAHSHSNTAFLADRNVAANRVRNRCPPDVAFVTDLSDRHVDVRQARVDSRGLALGATELEKGLS